MAKEKASSLYTILRYVIPFRMDIKNVSDFDEYARRVDADGNWERKTALDFSAESDLYEYVRNEFLFDDKDGGLDGAKIGATWSAKKNSNGIIKKLYFSDLTANKAQVLEKMVTMPRNYEDEFVFYITNGYKNSYKLGDEERQEMKRPFDNVTWYATKEGCSYVASYDSFGGSYSNKDFFTGTFPSKIRGDYFAMYLKVLYQTQSLLLYADRINHEISSDVQKYLYYPIEAEITSLYAEVNLFISKSMATSVSHIHQQSEFFNYLKKQLKIHEDVKSITSGLEAIEGLQREQLKHEEESHEKERDNKMQAIMGAFTLLAIASAFEDTLSFWNDLHDIKLTTPHIISFVIIGVISIVALIAIIVIFFKTFIKTSRFAKWCIRQKTE